MKGFRLSAQKAPQPEIPNVSVDVIPGLPTVQGAIAAAQAQEKKGKQGLDYGDDVVNILKVAAPMLGAAIPGISAAMEALMGQIQSQEASKAGTSIFGMSKQGVKG